MSPGDPFRICFAIVVFGSQLFVSLDSRNFQESTPGKNGIRRRTNTTCHQQTPLLAKLLTTPTTKMEHLKLEGIGPG